MSAEESNDSVSGGESEWKKIDIGKLIELVRVNECLYNPSLKEYNNKKYCNHVWKYIGTEVGVDGTEAKKLFKYKRDYYRKLKTKGGINGKGKQWEWTRHLAFLDPIFKIQSNKHSRSSTFQTSMVSDEENNEQSSCLPELPDIKIEFPRILTTVGDAHVSEESSTEEPFNRITRKGKKRKTESEVVRKLGEVVEITKDQHQQGSLDPDGQWLASFTQYLQDFSEEEKMEFQLDVTKFVIDKIREIKRRRMESC